MTLTATTPCLFCGEMDWHALPAPHKTHVFSSDGSASQEAFRKVACGACGAVQRLTGQQADEVEAFYTDVYDLYAKRPGAERFETGRYPALARTVADAVAPMIPRRVLEVGCGNGSALIELQRIWPEAEFVGLEPVPAAVNEAQGLGLPVWQGVMGQPLPPQVQGPFDVVFSLHVIEHTANPIEFLRAIKGLLTPEGRVVVTCPDSRLQNAELLHADHLYSMTPHHLQICAEAAGLVPTQAGPCAGAGGRDHEFNQFLVASNGHQVPSGAARALPDYLAPAERQQRFMDRVRYLETWQDISAHLAARIGDQGRLLCFGTGGWAGMVASYAPAIWERIEACVIDGGSDEAFRGKPVIDLASLSAQEADAPVILMAVNPSLQATIAERFNGSRFRPVTWFDLIGG
jgi:2-polyprenyl-3-methyl-5-hydroxy-6-metoxy-1,4-benzoquinol methylase